MAFAVRQTQQAVPQEENAAVAAKDGKVAGKIGQSLLQQGSKRR
jgi:hypothetical protein